MFAKNYFLQSLGSWARDEQPPRNILGAIPSNATSGSNGMPVSHNLKSLPESDHGPRFYFTSSHASKLRAPVQVCPMTIRLILAFFRAPFLQCRHFPGRIGFEVRSHTGVLLQPGP